MRQNFFAAEKDVYGNCTRILKPFFYLLTVFGLRPYAFPGETLKIGRFSVVGVIFCVPILIGTAYYTYNTFVVALLAISTIGFFSTLTMIMIVSLMGFILLLETLLYFLFATPKLSRFLELLDTLHLPEQSRKNFVNFVCATVILSILVFIAIAVIQVQFFLSAYVDGLHSIIDYLTFYVVIYLIAAFIFPFVLLALIAFLLYTAFDNHLKALISCPKNILDEELPTSHAEFIYLVNFVQQLDSCYSFQTLGTVGISLVSVCVFCLNIGRGNGQQPPPTAICSWIFLGALNFVGFGIVCTLLNDKSREIGSVLNDIPPNPKIHIWLEAFHRKLSDSGWGLTLGKLFLFERTACLGLFSAMFTFVAFYAQFSESAPVTNYNGTFTWSS